MKSNLILGLVIILLTSGCIPAKLDTSIFGDGDCRTPCWRGIRPGFTSKAEALAVVRSLGPDIRFSVDESFIYFSLGDKKHDRLHINSTDIVDWISLDLGSAELKQIVEIFGEPEVFLISLDSGGCILDIFYPAKGVSFQGHCESSAIGDYWLITPRTMMSSAYFVEQSAKVDGMLLLFFGEESLSILKDATRIWEGYGSYPINP
jgi:hypothetical protein